MRERAFGAMLGALGSVALLLCGCGGLSPSAPRQAASGPVRPVAVSPLGNRIAAQNPAITAHRSQPPFRRVQYAALEPTTTSDAQAIVDPLATRRINHAFQTAAAPTADHSLHLTVTKPAPVRSLLEMRHHDVIIQSWDLSCGAAALATLLRYEWGEPVTEKQVAQGLMGRREYIEHPDLVQIREGFSLLDLKRYVQRHGFKGEGLGELDFNDLIQNAPIMVPVNALGYNHFVIFRGVIGDRVLLADPAWGNRTMTIDKFKRMWLDYGKSMGHVGFVVDHPGVAPVSKMRPQLNEFVMFD